MHVEQNGPETTISKMTLKGCIAVRSTCETQFRHALQMLQELRDQAVIESERQRIAGKIDRLNDRFMNTPLSPTQSSGGVL